MADNKRITFKQLVRYKLKNHPRYITCLNLKRFLPENK